jgi:hypothetical protein
MSTYPLAPGSRLQPVVATQEMISQAYCHQEIQAIESPEGLWSLAQANSWADIRGLSVIRKSYFGGEMGV